LQFGTPLSHYRTTVQTTQKNQMKAVSKKDS